MQSAIYCWTVWVSIAAADNNFWLLAFVIPMVI
jgi:hypothetical protein